jgi:SAM-dependent methyltransferase
MGDERKAIVQAGYDALAGRYLEWARQVAGDPRERFVAEFAERLTDGARCLDLGCGAGIPSTRFLADRFDVVGVDVSEEQLRLARSHVPGARFIRADVSDVRFAPASFAGITALYAISHVPRDEHPELFQRLATWLGPGGVLLAVLGAGDELGWTGEWLGVPMYFSSYDADTNRSLLEAAGFELLVDEVVEMREPEGDVSFLWALGRKRV